MGRFNPHMDGGFYVEPGDKGDQTVTTKRRTKMPLRMFQVTGDMDFEIQVEAEDKEEAVKAVNKAVRVTLHHDDESEYSVRQVNRGVSPIYMEVTDSNVIAETSDVEEIEI